MDLKDRVPQYHLAVIKLRAVSSIFNRLNSEILDSECCFGVAILSVLAIKVYYYDNACINPDDMTVNYPPALYSTATSWILNKNSGGVRFGRTEQESQDLKRKQIMMSQKGLTASLKS